MLGSCFRPARSSKVTSSTRPLGRGGYATVYRAHDRRPSRGGTEGSRRPSPRLRTKPPDCEGNSSSRINSTIPMSSRCTQYGARLAHHGTGRRRDGDVGPTARTGCRAGADRRRAGLHPSAWPSCTATSSRPTSLSRRIFPAPCSSTSASPIRRRDRRQPARPARSVAAVHGTGASAPARPRRQAHRRVRAGVHGGRTVTGSPPFSAPIRIGLMDAHLPGPRRAYSRKIVWVPRVFDSVYGEALAKIPESRYGSCREFVSQVTRALD